MAAGGGTAPSESVVTWVTGASEFGRVTVRRADSGLSGQGEWSLITGQLPLTMVRPSMPESVDAVLVCGDVPGEPPTAQPVGKMAVMAIARAMGRWCMRVGRCPAVDGSGVEPPGSVPATGGGLRLHAASLCR